MESESPASPVSPSPTLNRRQLLSGAAGISGAAAASAAARTSGWAQENGLVPEGQAVVTSPRLPLTAIGSAELQAVVSGEIRDWREAGAPVSLRIELIALEGMIPYSKALRDSAADYDELADKMAVRPGAMAMVPVEEIDFRVNVLAVDGFDPLRHAPVGDEETISIAVVGDIVPGRNVNNKMVAYGDFTHPFHKVAGVLGSYDLAIANLEGNLSSTIAPPDDGHTFSFISDPAMIDGMKLAGLDAVSLANNHTRWNSVGWGDSALLDTIDALEQAGMGFFGAGRNLGEARAPWVAEVHGRSIAFLGVDGVTARVTPIPSDGENPADLRTAADYAGATDDAAGTNPYDLPTVLEDIEFLVDQHDIVIPYFHMGDEYIAVPPQWVVDGARAAINVGATMVVTNHPHVIQGMEWHHNKPIVYSVGNFIFDQMFAIDVRQGMILEILIRGDRVVGLRPRGVEIEDFNRPRLMDPGEHASLMNRFWWATDRLAERG